MTMTILSCISANAVTNEWTGSGNASVGGNWSLGHAPLSTEGVLLDTNTAALNWDAAATNTVASWTQTTNYTGTVTFGTVYGDSGFTNFYITGDVVMNGGTWTHLDDNVSTEQSRLKVSVGGDLTVGSDAAINVDSRGYDSAKGPGAPAGSSYDGGSYGGVGGDYYKNGVAGLPYGSIVSPTNLGSGGDIGSAGGGAVILDVGGTTTVAVASIISANGGSTVGSYGGGSGGSVYIRTGWLTGGGIISADGGVRARGAGAGGRVSVVLTQPGANFGSWSGTVSAYGGLNSWPGAAGTVFLKKTTDNGTLRVDNNGTSVRLGWIESRMPDNVDLNTFTSIVITNEGVLAVDGDNAVDLTSAAITGGGALHIIADDLVTYPAAWTITTAYKVLGDGITSNLTDVTIADGGLMSHACNWDEPSLYRLDLTIAGNLTVQSNGMIAADGIGFGPRKGPGYHGNEAVYRSYDGGTYGGIGGDYERWMHGFVPPVLPYGSVTAPTNVGSGGYTFAGGGAIMLTVAGTTTVETAGIISADGDGGSGGADYAGGSGGSVYLTTGRLQGSGSIQASGGDGVRASGGGGRVAVILTQPGADFSTWSGSTTAYGGTDGSEASAGTVYLKATAGNGMLIVNNDGTQVECDWYSARLPDGQSMNVFDSVVITNEGILSIDADNILDLTSASISGGGILHIVADDQVIYPVTWTITDAYQVLGDGITSNLTNVIVASGGILSHANNFTNNAHSLDLTITGDLTVQSNGTISANGKGYYMFSGPAWGEIYDGGGHGGRGGDRLDIPPDTGPTYGLVRSPTTMGSSGYSTPGGGTVILNVLGTTRIETNAVIEADGSAGVNGGGAGGSVYIRTGGLEGVGSIHANGGTSTYGSGGGGRVAVILTGSGTNFIDFDIGGTMSAYGGSSGSKLGAAGTVYREIQENGSGKGTVFVDNDDLSTDAATSTHLPPDNDPLQDLEWSKWRVRNEGRLELSTNVIVRTLDLMTNATFELTGYTVNLTELIINGSKYRNGIYSAGDLPQVFDGVGGGQVIVSNEKGTVFILR